MRPLTAAWASFAASPIFGLLTTLFAYEIALEFQRRLRGSMLANPVLVATGLVILLLQAAGIPYRTYMSGAGPIFFLLGPATVALAVPLHRHAVQLRRSAARLCLAAGIGAAAAAASAVGIAAAFGAPGVVLRSIAPKSVTTAIAIGVSQQIGGQPGLTAALVVTTGILGAVMAGAVLDLVRVRSQRLRGLAIGVTSHGIGTAYALTVDAETGAYASAGMAFSGILTGLLLPSAWTWIMGR